MIDVDQRREVSDAISWVNRLAEFNPYWVQEPTSTDDIPGHAADRKLTALSLDAPGYWGNDLTRLAMVTGLEDRSIGGTGPTLHTPRAPEWPATAARAWTAT